MRTVFVAAGPLIVILILVCPLDPSILYEPPALHPLYHVSHFFYSLAGFAWQLLPSLPSDRDTDLSVPLSSDITGDKLLDANAGSPGNYSRELSADDHSFSVDTSLLIPGQGQEEAAVAAEGNTAQTSASELGPSFGEASFASIPQVQTRLPPNFSTLSCSAGSRLIIAAAAAARESGEDGTIGSLISSAGSTGGVDFCHFEDLSAAVTADSYVRHTIYYYFLSARAVDKGGENGKSHPNSSGESGRKHDDEKDRESYSSVPRELRESVQAALGKGYGAVHAAAVISSSDVVWLQGWLYIPRRETTEEMGSSPEGGYPLMVMAHGLGGQKDTGLDKFAERFVESGKLAVFVFDYRTWGGSGGYPRHLSIPSELVADWTGTVKVLVDSGGLGGQPVDASRMVLWGTSLSGGHVVTTFHKLTEEEEEGNNKRYTSNIKGMIGLVPFLDGRNATMASILNRGIWKTLRLSYIFISDYLRRELHRGFVAPRLTQPSPNSRSLITPYSCRVPSSSRDPLAVPTSFSPSAASFLLTPFWNSLHSHLCGTIYIKIASPSSSYDISMMTMSEKDYATWAKKVSPATFAKTAGVSVAADLLGGWTNSIAAMSAASLRSYRPIEFIKSISVPLLFISSSKDALCPPSLVRAAIQSINDSEDAPTFPPVVESTKSTSPKAFFYEVADVSHFDVYYEPMLSQLARTMTAFALTYTEGGRDHAA